MPVKVLVYWLTSAGLMTEKFFQAGSVDFGLLKKHVLGLHSCRRF
jgi:hypothetical protein